MKLNRCKKILLTLLVSVLLFGSVNCFASAKTADEVNTLIGGIVSSEAASKGVGGKQGLVDFYSSNEMTLGGEWYVISFIQNSDNCDFSVYEKKLIDYLKNNTVYSATTREKFALTLIALDTKDSWAKQYIKDTADEAIGKQGIMSLVFGLHLLNNGCKNSQYTAYSLAEKIISLQNDDGGWANSGSKSDADVTAMTLQSLYPFYFLMKNSMDKAIELLSEMQGDDGTYKSYGVYNAESTAQVIIALSTLGINADSDSRFIKNSCSALDGLMSFKTAEGSFSHIQGDKRNASATSQSLNALVAYSRFINGRGPFYRLPHLFVTPKQSEEITTAPAPETTGPQNLDEVQIPSVHTEQTYTQVVLTENTETVQMTEGVSESETDIPETSVPTDSGELTNTAELTEIQTLEDGEANVSITLSKSFKIKLCIAAALLLAAVTASVILIILGKRNPKNFIVIAAAAVILITGVFCMRISVTDEYYSSTESKGTVKGTVTIEVRCDTVAGRENAPKNPVILEKTEIGLSENDTVYDILADALRNSGIPFEHNSSYYISGIDNLYEFEFGDLSGWMYLVNGDTPSVGCGEYKPVDGDEIQWLYTCDIGNDLKQNEKD